MVGINVTLLDYYFLSMILYCLMEQVGTGNQDHDKYQNLMLSDFICRIRVI